MKKENIWTPIIESELYKFLADENGDVDVDVKKMMNYSLGRVLYKTLNSQLPAGGSIFDFHHACESSKLLHISDWLIAAHINNEPWLQNVDERGRPKKLLKFSTVEQIIAEADKAMLKASQKNRDIKLDETQETLLEQLDGGYTLVELLSPEALDRESAFMQHCIGNGSYDSRLKSPRFQYLSLRDANNKPHATMELILNSNNIWEIQQLQGKQNYAPIQKYIELILPFIKDRKLAFSTGARRNFPYVIDKNCDFHHYNNLPSTVECHTFGPGPKSTSDDMGQIKMPLRLAVDDSIIINIKKLDGFPESITFNPAKKAERGVYGLNISFVEIDNAYGDIHIGESTKFDGVKFLTEPESFTVDGELRLYFHHNSKTPKTISASGNIFIFGYTGEEFNSKFEKCTNVAFWQCRNLNKFKYGLDIQGILSIFDSPISELPDGISVRELRLSQTNVLSLPEGTRISEKLVIDDPDTFQHIPDSIDDDVEIEVSGLLDELLNDQVMGRLHMTKEQTGSITVGEWRALRQQLRM